MANRIVPVIVRGRLFFRVKDVLFPSLRAAMCAYTAAESQRLSVVDGGAQ
jgi:hypothetical protein